MERGVKGETEGTKGGGEGNKERKEEKGRV